MAIVNRNLLNARFTDYKREFNTSFGQFEKMSADWKTVSFRVPSTTDMNDYAALLELPAVTQWIGPRTISNITAQQYALQNLDWQVTIQISRNNIEDNKDGMVMERIKRLPGQFGKRVRSDVFLAYRNGSAAASLGWDGVPYFDANHPVGAGVIPNEDLMGANPHPWILFDSKIDMGGVLFQERKKPYATTLGAGSEWAYHNNTYLFSGNSRYVIGYGHWQAAYMSNQAFTEAFFWAAYNAMLAFVDANGYEIGVDPDTLIYHPADTALVRRILKKTGLYWDGTGAVDSAARGVIRNLVPCAYL